MIKIGGYIFSIILIIGLSGCQYEKSGTKYYNGCSDINHKKDSKDAKFMKNKISNNLKIQKEILTSLNFRINKDVTYKDVCVNIIRFKDNSDSFSIINKMSIKIN